MLGNYGRRLEIVVSIVLALLAAGGVWYWQSLWSRSQELVPVAAAARDLTAARLLVASDVIMIKIPRQALPAIALVDPARAVGQPLVRSKAAREILTAADVGRQYDPTSEAALVSPGRLGFLLPANWLAAAMPRLKKNDAVTIYGAGASLAGRASAVGAIARLVTVLRVTDDKEGIPAAVLLSVDEPTVERLLQARTAQYQLIMVVEPASSPFTTSTRL